MSQNPQISMPQILTSAPGYFWVRKPSGWLTIPGRGETHKTSPVLLPWLSEQTGERLFTVHRLDFETEGGILVARNEAVHRDLSRQFEERKVRKTYRAVSTRKNESVRVLPNFQVKLPIDEKLSHTTFKVLREKGDHLEIACDLLTGRRQQIRIHLGSVGLPIVGDVKRGGVSMGLDPSILLWAESVLILDPQTAKPLRLDSPMPRIYAEYTARVFA